MLEDSALSSRCTPGQYTLCHCVTVCWSCSLARCTAASTMRTTRASCGRRCLLRCFASWRHTQGTPLASLGTHWGAPWPPCAGSTSRYAPAVPPGMQGKGGCRHLCVFQRCLARVEFLCSSFARARAVSWLLLATESPQSRGMSWRCLAAGGACWRRLSWGARPLHEDIPQTLHCDFCTQALQALPSLSLLCSPWLCAGGAQRLQRQGVGGNVWVPARGELGVRGLLQARAPLEREGNPRARPGGAPAAAHAAGRDPGVPPRCPRGRPQTETLAYHHVAQEVGHTPCRGLGAGSVGSRAKDVAR